MSYSVRKNNDGEILVYPLEIPMYDGNNPEMGRQAEVALASCLRHFAVVDAILDGEVIDPTEDEPNDALNTHYAQGSEQLISCLMCLLSLADNYTLDIMQELLEVPWLI